MGGQQSAHQYPDLPFQRQPAAAQQPITGQPIRGQTYGTQQPFPPQPQPTQPSDSSGSESDDSATGPVPDDWPDRYTDWSQIGDYGRVGHAFGESGQEEYHKRILRRRGYDLDVCIAREEDNLYDNQVWKVRHRKEGVMFAAKVASIQYYYRPGFYPACEALLRESHALRRLSHENIVRLRQVFGLRDRQTKFPFTFQVSVMELMDSTLAAKQDKYLTRRMTEPQARQWFRQIAAAVDYLHNGCPGYRVSHLAIRPVNILYKVVDSHRDVNVYKLTDFEESLTFESMDAEDRYPRRRYRGNEWSPPEMARGGAMRDGGQPTRPMDVYSLGYTLCTTLLGDHPWPREGYFRWMNGQIPNSSLSPDQLELYSNLGEVSLLFCSMCQFDAGQRPTIKEVLSDPWVIGEREPVRAGDQRIL